MIKTLLLLTLVIYESLQDCPINSYPRGTVVGNHYFIQTRFKPFLIMTLANMVESLNSREHLLRE